MLGPYGIALAIGSAHGIIILMNFTRFPHEICLYAGKFQSRTFVLLRQADNFAIASPSPELDNSFLDVIDKNLKKKLKWKDLLSSFNRSEIQKTSLSANI